VAALTDTWEPANQVEQQLRDALRDGDQDTYFALVNTAELFVPLPPGEAEAVLANQAPFTWPTSTRDGRTHVLAYTSGEAARACLGPTYEQFVRMTLADMARSWPNQEWWLALNSGLPIEGYLPAWFIGQLTAGIAPANMSPDAAPPQAVYSQESAPLQQVAPPQEVTPPYDAPPVQDAATPSETAPAMPVREDAPPPAPGPDDAPAPPLPSDQHAVQPPPMPQDETVLDGIPPVPAAPAPVSAPDSVSPSSAFPEPPQDPPVAEPPPSAEMPAPDDGPFEVDASALILHITPGAEFTALDEEERTLHDAAARGDRKAFLRTLLGVRQIWVPVVEGGDLMLAPGRPGFQWYVDESSGRPVVPIYTGPGRMREAMGGHPFVLSDLAKVLRFWSDPSWELAINGGTPIGASIPGERIPTMSSQVDADAAARLASDFPAQSDAERQMFNLRNDPEMVVRSSSTPRSSCRCGAGHRPRCRPGPATTTSRGRRCRYAAACRCSRSRRSTG
jgi:hypothetical protein